jgi:urease accessory protein
LGKLIRHGIGLGAAGQGGGVMNAGFYGRTALAESMTQAGLSRFVSQGSIRFSGAEACLAELKQQAPIRFLRPYPEDGDPATAVLLNTAGGIVGGDRLTMDISVDAGAQVLVTGQAAEKVYRSDGETAELRVTLSSRSGAALEFLPQGTILFDRSALRRRTVLRVDDDARLLFGEMLYFGRTAMGERFTAGAIDDRTDVEWGGRRVMVDVFRIENGGFAAMNSLSGLDGATCAAVMVLLTPSPEQYLAGIRADLERLAQAGYQAGAAVFPQGPLIVRWLGRDAEAVRRSFGMVWRHVRSVVLGRPARMPRIWSI